MTIMTSSKAFANNGSAAELFADSFDSWIEPSEATPQNQSSENTSAVPATNDMKWVAWTESAISAKGPTENVEVLKPRSPRYAARSGERWLRGVAWAVGGLVGLLLIVSLLFTFARARKPVAIKTALPKTTTMKRAARPKTKALNVVSRNVPLVRRASLAPRKTLRRPKSTRVVRNQTSEGQAIILGRGPVREDTRSIIFIRD